MASFRMEAGKIQGEPGTFCSQKEELFKEGVSKGINVSLKELLAILETH